MARPKIAALRTTPQTVVTDYGRLMRLASYRSVIDPSVSTIIKLNLSWTKYFPACSSQPWQVEGVLSTMLEDGYDRTRLLPAENKTVVTDPWKGAANNRWLPVLQDLGLTFTALPEVEWRVYRFRSPLLKLNAIFPEGIEIPAIYPGKNIVHLPTVKTHGHATTTGSIKNSFGGLLKEVRHYAHKHMHEVLVDLMYMQKELHPGIFTVMDGTVCGDGAGPRTMEPVVGNVILAGADSVAIDAVAARLMGFDPLSIRYLRMCHDRGLGVADPREIELVGDDVSDVNLHFKVRRSLVIWGDQMLRRGPLRFLEKIALHSPLVVWAPVASNFYHDLLWYPTVGRAKIARFRGTEWGRLFDERYGGPRGQTRAVPRPAGVPAPHA
ncbi:MAG: iron-sulfur cluster-binding protein [Acidobacteria bacterium 13_1_40CM_2_68_5]|nr:MAG: iron-sulfur cluster-binding protein [Acidobacteria bacterium 13_1_40CM_2_68_5]